MPDNTPAEADKYRTKLPPAVRNVVARGDETFKQLSLPGMEPEEDPDEKDAVGEGGEGKAKPTGDASPSAGEGKPPAKKSEGEPGPAMVPADEYARVEYEARKHQGRYDKLKADTDKRIGELERELEALRKAGPKASASGVTDEEREAYGEDLIDLMERVADSKYGKEIQELRQRVASTPPPTSSENTMDTETQAMYDYMDKVIPDWRTQNQDPGFLKWLQEEDPIAGRRRQEILQDASANKSAVHIARIFTAYRQTAPMASPPASQGASDGVDLASLAAPTSGGGSAPSGSASVVVYTNDEVAKFYADVGKGRYKNNPEGKAKMERELATAAREGRIVDQAQLARMRSTGSR